MTQRDITHQPAESQSPKEWLKQLQDITGKTRDEVTIMSSGNDPTNFGTELDHQKAQWFAEQWERAVADKKVKAIHLRGVHYVIISMDEDIEAPTPDLDWDIYRNTEYCWQVLGVCSTRARVLGYIPEGGVIDEKNDVQKITQYGNHFHTTPNNNSVNGHTGLLVPNLSTGNPAELTFESYPDYIARRMANDVENSLSIDEESQQPFHIEIWSEKTIPSVVKDAANKSGVSAIVEGQGSLSYTVARDFIERANNAQKPAVVLYLADFDPKGENMVPEMVSKINWHDIEGSIDNRVVIDRLAITEDQIKTHDLPRAMISKSDEESGVNPYDGLIDDFEKRRGVGATELNALESDIDLYKEIVCDAVEDLRDDNLRKKNERAKSAYKDLVKDAARQAAKDVGFDGQTYEPDIRDWVERFNEQYYQVEREISKLEDMKREDAYTEWLDAAGEVPDHVSLPKFDVPGGDASPPSDPLYDSEWSYLKILNRVEKYRNGAK